MDFEEFCRFVSDAGGKEGEHRMRLFEEITQSERMAALHRATHSRVFAGWDDWHQQALQEGTPEYLWKHPPRPTPGGCCGGFRGLCHDVYTWKHFDKTILTIILINATFTVLVLSKQSVAGFTVQDFLSEAAPA